VLDKSRNEYLGLFAVLFVAPQRRICLIRLLFRASITTKMPGVFVPGLVQHDTMLDRPRTVQYSIIHRPRFRGYVLARPFRVFPAMPRWSHLGAELTPPCGKVSIR
jgi:hypothetical protein